MARIGPPLTPTGGRSWILLCVSAWQTQLGQVVLVVMTPVPVWLRKKSGFWSSPHRQRGLIPSWLLLQEVAHSELGLIDWWLPSWFYSGLSSVIPSSLRVGEDRGSFTFAVDGVSLKQVVGALPRHGLCHLPSRLVTERFTNTRVTLPWACWEQSERALQILLHTAVVPGLSEAALLFDLFYLSVFIDKNL